jgi:hypothetical protein
LTRIREEMGHFGIAFFNIECLAKFKLQANTLYCISKLDRKAAFLTVVNILKMNVLGFFWQFQTLSINASSLKRLRNNGHPNCSKT